MSRRSGMIGLWTIGLVLVTTACGGNAAPAASGAATASPSSVALVASPSPTPSPSPSATPTPIPTATPTPTPKPTPVPWKTYKSKRFRYQMKYPPDWVVTPGSSTRADQFDDYGSHYVYVSRDTVSTFVDLAATVAHEKALIKSHYAGKLLSDKRISVGSYSGRLLTFNGSLDGRKLYIQVVVIKRGAVGYFVEMFSDRGTEAADRKLFLRMYNSFRPT